MTWGLERFILSITDNIVLPANEVRMLGVSMFHKFRIVMEECTPSIEQRSSSVTEHNQTLP